MDIFQTQRVKWLLRKPKEESNELETLCAKFKAWLCNLNSVYGYVPSRAFKFSNRALCVHAVIIFIAYQLMVFTSLLSQNLQVSAKDLMRDTDLLFTIYNAFNFSLNAEETTYMITDMLYYSWFVSGMVTGSFRFLHIVLGLSSIRADTLSLWRGDHSFIPSSYIMSGSCSVAQTLRYAGYTIAYSVWTQFLVYMTILICLLILICRFEKAEVPCAHFFVVFFTIFCLKT